MNQKVIEKLYHCLSAEFETVKNNSIIKNDDGSIDIFDLFKATEHNGMIEIKQSQKDPKEFSSYRSALSWCIAEKCQEIELAKKIIVLDKDLQRHKNMDRALKHVCNKITNADQKSIAEIKHHDVIHKLRLTNFALQKCIARAKYLQIRGFHNEIARTRRPAPTRNY